MKILFIYPDIGAEVGYSAGLGILSALLKRDGHETGLIHVTDELDYPLDLKRINQDIKAFGPGLICFSVATNLWNTACRIGRSIGREHSIPVLVGGHHATAAPGSVMKEPWIDFVCRGEGEKTLPELVGRLAGGAPVDGVANLVHRRNDKVICEPLGAWVSDLDTLPFDDYSLFDYARIIETRSGWAEVIVTRGCQFACTYCFNQPLFERYRADLPRLTRRDYVRRNSVPYVMDKLKKVRWDFPNIKGITFVDDVFANNSEWFQEFARRYKNEIGLPYACTSHPSFFDRKVAELLRESGCKVVKMGVESGSAKLRRSILKRNVTNDHLMEIFGIAKEFDLKPQAFNMIGLPGETIENIKQTIRLNARIMPYIVWVSTFSPNPGTELYRNCRKKRMIDESKWAQVDNFRSDSVLKERALPAVEFKKIRVMFRWYLNEYLDNEAKGDYRKNIRKLQSLPDGQWKNGTAEAMFRKMDDETDREMRSRNVSHYVRKKYINILWGKEYDYDLT